jgi:N-acetylglucosamine-6-phosphate deacetylase
MLFENVTLILPDRLSPGSRLRVLDGVIQEIGVEARAAPGDEVIDCQGGFLAPGFIDLHVHGALGHDAMAATPEAFEAILGFHASGGTTTLALTSVAAPLEAVWRLLDFARAWRSSPWPGARLLGVHLEGPYFAPSKAGAHNPAFLRTPAPEDTAALLEFADVITQVTLAPELPGALDLIAALRGRGIVASGGHSDAWEEDAQRAFAAGMEQVTHVFNAMSSARRRGPYRVAGLLECALADPRVRCELIADGHHVSPTLMKMLWRAKGPDAICLITDASPGAGLEDGARYVLGNLPCVVQGGVGLTLDGQALAGSTCTMIRGVRNLIRLVGLPLAHAVRLATLNPARALGIADRRGSLAPGLDADLVLLSPDLEVVATYVAGRRVYPFEEASIRGAPSVH